MKKSIFMAAIAMATAITFTLSSCQKEEASAEETPTVVKTCYAPRFRNKTMTYTCTLGHSCYTSPLSPFTKFPRMNWKVGSECPADSYTGPVNYYVYKYTGVSGGYNQYLKTDGFTCAGTNIWYAGTSFLYNNTYIIIADISGTTYPTNIMEDVWGNVYYTTGPTLPQSDVWKFNTGTNPSIPCL